MLHDMKPKSLAQAILAGMQALIQSVATLLRGVAIEGEKTPFFCRPWVYVGFVLGELIASPLATHAILSQHNPWLYPFLVPVMMLGQAGAWGTYIVLVHQGSHGTIAKNPSVNRWLAEIGSILILTYGHEDYSKAHLGKHHHKRTLATSQDPDLRFLIRIGFVPGKPIEFYWKLFVFTIFNPLLYLTFAWKRIKRNFF
ncbi:MAG: fatty acid desaturase [Thermosynechococcaceae cyanobacterium]